MSGPPNNSFSWSLAASGGKAAPHWTRQRIAVVVIPEGRSPIRDRNTLKRIFFLRSRLALRLAGMTKREASGVAIRLSVQWSSPSVATPSW